MYYATFFQRAAYPPNSDKLVEASGDRAVVILDGRETSRTHAAIAADECLKRGFVAYQLHKGERLSRTPVKSLAIVRVDSRTDIETISERINAKQAARQS